MATARDELVAEFQEITAIDDVAVAMFHLEQANWDLLTAINQALPADLSFTNYNQNPPQNNADVVDVEMIDDDISVIKPFFPKPRPVDRPKRNFGASTSCDEPPIRLMEFCIHYLEKTHEIEMSDTATVGDLRSRIYDVTGVPSCRQILDGLGNQMCPKPLPKATLASLNLPDACDIFMTVPEEHHHDDSLANRLAQTYTLKIDSENKPYTLHFPGTHTVLQVKEDVYSLTNIPVRHQAWTGWPNIPDLDSKQLALAGISTEHKFKLKTSAAKTTHKRIIINTDSEESDDYEDAVEDEPFHVEDDFLDNEMKKDEPLIPDNTEDEAVGCFLFAVRFKERYGSAHPLFFQGSLDDAIKDSCMRPAKDRRLLAIYLHHEASISSNVFCTQLLIKESVLQVLAANFLVYGWDLTFESNKNMFLSSLSNALGTQASMTVKNMPLDRLPVLMIIMRIRSSTEIFSVINGDVSLEELVGKLMEGVERWSSRRDEEIQEEQERAARQMVKWEQDEAYRQSLEADRAKEELKKKLEMAEHNERQRVEIERQEINAIKEAQRSIALSRLPAEPEAANGENITKIRVRLPEGKSLERRFTVETPLSALLDFLTVEGYHFDEYKVISSWPRRDLTTLDWNQTFTDLKLYPQESVILEARSSE